MGPIAALGRSWMTRILAVAAAVLMVVAIAQAAYIATRPEPVVHLNYPLQRVTSRIPGMDTPAVLTSGVLAVEGAKCNMSPEKIPVAGTTSWVAIDPPGTVIDTGHGASVRRPGCESSHYSNPIPSSVIEATQRLAADVGAPCVTWRLTGLEVPTDPMISSAIWQTEPFAVCIRSKTGDSP